MSELEERMKEKSRLMNGFRQMGDLPTVEKLSDCPEGGAWVYCEEQQYLIRRTASGTIVGIMPLIYTWGLFRGGDDYGYSERWCFEYLETAIANGHVMTDDSEPIGFIRKV